MSKKKRDKHKHGARKSSGSKGSGSHKGDRDGRSGDDAPDDAEREATDSGQEESGAPDAKPFQRDPKVEELLRSEDLFERAMKHADSPELMRELQKLSPDEAAMFVILVEKQLKKRRIELIGYALGLLGLLGGMLFALYLYATREPGEFMGWAFLIPFVLVGAVFLIFGQLAKRS